MGTYFQNGSKKEGIVTENSTGAVLFMGFIWTELFPVTGERLKLDHQGNPEMIMNGEWNQSGEFIGKVRMVSHLRPRPFSHEGVDSMMSSSSSPSPMHNNSLLQNTLLTQGTLSQPSSPPLSQGNGQGSFSEMHSSSTTVSNSIKSEEVDPGDGRTLQTALVLSNLHASTLKIRFPRPIRNSVPQRSTLQSSQREMSSIQSLSSSVHLKKALYKKYTLGRTFLEECFPEHKFGYGEGALMGSESLPDNLFEFLKELDKTEEGKKKLKSILVLRKPLTIDRQEAVQRI